MVRAVSSVLGIDPKRIPGLDVFRGLAVTCMVVVHAAHVTHDRASIDPFRTCLTLFEPAISAAFLWLVGWSLHQSYLRRAIGAVQHGASQTGTSWRRWYRHCALRAATLYAVGVVLFLLQYGVQSPDVWASPDILSTIAWAILLVGVLLPLGTRGLFGGAVALLAVLTTIQVLGVDVSGVNAGPGATVPLIAIACVGACHGLSQQELAGVRSKQVLWVLGGVLCSLIALGLPGELVDQHASRYTDGTVWFWNHTFRGVALYGGAVVAAAAFAQSSEWCSRASPWTAPLSLLGRHALLTYVGHLLVLGAMDRWLSLPPPGWSSFATLSLALLGAFMGIAMVVESKAG
jgi:hypothetical protein